MLLDGLDAVGWSRCCWMVSMLLDGLDAVGWSRCCWNGHVSIANPEIAPTMIRNLSEIENPGNLKF